MGKFVHLHLHTEYSLLDGCVRLTTGAKHDVHPLADALRARDMDAVAITDHGNMYGVYSFVESLKGTGIKPIIGEEFYTCDNMHERNKDSKRYHLILLAKNETGYRNLIKLSSMAFLEGFYSKPRIDLDALAQHSEGLICLSACIVGAIPRLLLDGRYDEAKAYAIRLRDMFAPGDFYIELQDHGIEEELRVRNDLVRIAKEIGVKVVATNDVHYIEKEDAEIQDDMMCIQLGCRKNEPNGVRFEKQEFYLKSAEEMEELFGWCPEALESTVEIANKIEFEFKLSLGHYLIPPFDAEDLNGRTPEQYLRDLAWDGLQKRYETITPEIKKRINYELDVICECGYATYFLIVWDYVNAARKMDIPVGPGRGSGVGSIVAYSIGITDVDPLRFKLIFERFLSKERISMPDFDIDFCYVRRNEIIDYVTKKYGSDRVTQIIAYGTMKAKQAIKDVARIYNIPYEESNIWAKTIPNNPKVTIKGCLDENNEVFAPEFKKLYEENPEARKIIEKAIMIEGMPRQTSMHAAGVIICSDPVVNYIPLAENNDFVITQFDKTQIEPLGMLKMDFLGLKTLTDIKEAQKYILEDKGIEIDFHKLGYDDPKIYELIGSGDCMAVFQLESGGMSDFMSRLKPTSLEDVIAGISIFRPGPMQFMDKFIEGKRNPEKVTYLHPKLKPILEVTYGCIIYQEQVMQIAREIAGYSFGGADILRKAISKKKADVLMSQKETFTHGGKIPGDPTGKIVDGALLRGVPEEVVDVLFKQIIDFADYCFNKSHATAYAVLSYQTAYLKCYFPVHFLTAIINNRIGDAKEQSHYISYMKRIGINILKPDINKSKKKFSIDGNNVRFGLMGIKNVGEAAIEAVLKERENNGLFKDIRDFFDRCGNELNSRMIESLILSGALDSFGKNRATLYASYKAILDAVNRDRKNKESGQISFFDGDLFGVANDIAPIKFIEREEYSKQELLKEEKANLGMYISGHPLDDYAPYNNFKFTIDSLLLSNEAAEEAEDQYDNSYDGQTVKFGCVVEKWDKKKTKKNQVFAAGRLEDLSGDIEFTMFPQVYERDYDALTSDNPVIVSGKIDLKGAEPKLIVDSMEIWNIGSSNTKDIPTNTNGDENIIQILCITEAEKDLIKTICQANPGEDTIRIIVGRKKEERKAYRGKVNLTDEVIVQIKNIVGESRVKVN